MIRTALLALGLLLASCSFIGARIPEAPAPDYHCPEGVIIVDGLGAALALVPVGLGTYALIKNDSQAAVAALIVTPVMAIVAGIYVGSAIYGAGQHSRCERLKVQAAEAWQANGAREREPARQKVVGQEPLHCAMTAADVGACFFDEAECAAAANSAGATCETKASGSCFDVTDVIGTKQTACAASLIDCEARRVRFTSDRTLTVTKCGTYEVAGHAGSAP